MTAVYLVHAKRTPIGKIGGALSLKRPDDLLADLFKNHSETLTYDPKEIDDVIVGCANQAGEDNRNIARMSLLLSGLPIEIPGVTLNRLCASSLDATIDGYARIKAGIADCIWIGGVESMTRAPLVMSKSESSFGRDHKLYDSTFGWRFPNPIMEEMFPLLSMGETAEQVQNIYKIPRILQDEFALSSHQKAVAANYRGDFLEEILPITIKERKKETIVSLDEGPREDTTLDILSKLKPAFKKEGTVTAGNASSMNDGAAMAVLVSESFLKKHKLTQLY